MSRRPQLEPWDGSHQMAYEIPPLSEIRIRPGLTGMEARLIDALRNAQLRIHSDICSPGRCVGECIGARAAVAHFYPLANADD